MSPARKKDDLLAKSSHINRGSVTKAAYPSYVGMTPEYDNILMTSTEASYTEKNKLANERA